LPKALQLLQFDVFFLYKSKGLFCIPQQKSTEEKIISVKKPLSAFLCGKIDA
jgi:hypothetical protein